MEPRNFSANRKFSPVRNDSNLNGNHIGITAKTNNILNKRQIESIKEYRVEDFQYLIGTEHIDPDNQLKYKTIAIRRYGNKIAADRRLVGSEAGRIEAIHALDVAAMTDSTPVYARRGIGLSKVDALRGDVVTKVDALRGDEVTKVDALRGDEDNMDASHRRKRTQDDGGPYSSERRKGPAVGAYKDSADNTSQESETKTI